MIELDLAVAIIFVLGLLGLWIEPWSPHPIGMAAFGFGYFCTRFAAPIMVRLTWKKRR